MRLILHSRSALLISKDSTKGRREASTIQCLSVFKAEKVCKLLLRSQG